MVDSLVRVVQPANMNLFGLLLAGFLSKQLASPKTAKKVRKMRGSYGIRAGTMQVTVVFGPDGVLVHRGLVCRTRARIAASVQEFVALVMAGSVLAAVIAVLEGRVCIGGNPFALVKLLPIMLTKKAPR